MNFLKFFFVLVLISGTTLARAEPHGILILRAEITSDGKVSQIETSAHPIGQYTSSDGPGSPVKVSLIRGGTSLYEVNILPSFEMIFSGRTASEKVTLDKTIMVVSVPNLPTATHVKIKAYSKPEILVPICRANCGSGK